MVVHPAPGHPEGTLVNAVLHHCGLPALDLAPGQAPPDVLSNWPGAPAAACRLPAADCHAPSAVASSIAIEKMVGETRGCRTVEVPAFFGRTSDRSHPGGCRVSFCAPAFPGFPEPRCQSRSFNPLDLFGLAVLRAMPGTVFGGDFRTPHAGMDWTTAEINSPLLSYLNWGAHARRCLIVSRSDWGRRRSGGAVGGG